MSTEGATSNVKFNCWNKDELDVLLTYIKKDMDHGRELALITLLLCLKGALTPGIPEEGEFVLLSHADITKIKVILYCVKN